MLIPFTTMKYNQDSTHKLMLT